MTVSVNSATAADGNAHVLREQLPPICFLCKTHIFRGHALRVLLAKAGLLSNVNSLSLDNLLTRPATITFTNVLREPARQLVPHLHVKNINAVPRDYHFDLH